MTIVGNDVVEEGHLKGSLCLVVGKGGVEEGTFVTMRVVATASTWVPHDFDTRRARRLDWTTIELVGGILVGTISFAGFRTTRSARVQF